jgi:hypothetical protein
MENDIEKKNLDQESLNREAFENSGKPTPIIDLSLARQRAEARRKQQELEQKQREEERRARAMQSGYEMGAGSGAYGGFSGYRGRGLSVSGKVFKVVRVVQLVFVVLALVYLARSCGAL